MGVVNVTPDSFSDGGKFLDAERAVAHGLALVEEGADVLDIGGESTRPGAAPVPAAEEIGRVLPVIAGLVRATDTPLSIDTMKAAVAEAAVAGGARIVNDVSGGEADPQMLPTLGRLSKDVPLNVVLMHRQGDPASMQEDPRYGDPVDEVRTHLEGRVQAAVAAGIPAERIALDPGIGFGKALGHNLALLARLDEIAALGHPILLGVSRKSFIGHITGQERPADWKTARRSDAPADRLGGTAAALALGIRGGAEILRVHDVRIMREAALVAQAIHRAERHAPRG